MPNRFKALAGLAIGTACLFADPTSGAATESYETPSTLRASDDLSEELLEGRHHEVMCDVENDGYMNYYRIASDFGRFDAYGRTMLAVRIQEIEAIAALDELSKTDVFIDALKASAFRQVDTVKTLADRPVETLMGVPAGLGRMFKRYKRKAEDGAEKVREVGTQVKEEFLEAASDDDEEDEGEEPGERTDKGESKTDQALDAAGKYAKKYFGLSRAERRWAQELGIDPYTSNEVLKRAIRQVARVEASATFGMKFVALPSIPGVGYIRDINSLVWSKDPLDLRLHNEKVLARTGASEEQVTAFLDNPWFSPTLQSTAIEAIAALEGVNGRQTLLLQATLMDSLETARFFTQNLRMLAWHHERNSPLERILDSRLVTTAMTENRRFVAIAAVDHVYWTEEVAAAAERFVETAQTAGAERLEMRLLGGLSERCRRELQARGFVIYSNEAIALEGSRE